jgi:mannitol/fructose-specific phosphotransferase system IIA component (Ntr-type)
MAMGKDQLIPHSFAKLSKQGTPTFSILFTSCFMIIVILFLDLENLVKTASLLKILLFLFVMLSLIIMRESKIRHYRPKFRSPFYPWVQLVGIGGLVFLIFEMGFIPMLLVGVFILFGFLWYWFYARDKVWREYSLLHLVERVTGEKNTSYLLDEELREILIERDDITEKRFEDLLRKCKIIDTFKYERPDKFARLIANTLSNRLDIDKKKLYNLIMKREKDSNIMVRPGIAILSNIIDERNKFEIIIVRSKKGIMLFDNLPPFHAFFVVVSTSEQQSFYMHSLMWIVQIAEEIDFEKKWLDAKDIHELRNIILSSWRKRKRY